MTDEFWKRFNAVVAAREKFNQTYADDAKTSLAGSVGGLVAWCSDAGSSLDFCTNATDAKMLHIAVKYCRAHDITMKQIKGDRRSKDFAVPRMKAMAECAHSGKFTLTQIGQFFGGRDHTTVAHAMKRFPASCFRV
jgi:hypothetical protein